MPFSLNNQYDQLGTVKDIIHGNRINTPIGIELTYGNEHEEHKFTIELKYRKILRQLEISSFEYLRKSLYYYKTRKDAYDIILSGKRIEDVIPHMTKRRPAFYSIIPVDQVISKFTGINRGVSDRQLLPWQTKLVNEVSNGMRNARIELRRNFELYDSLSPFRDQPQRTYLFTGEVYSRVGRTGSNSISILVSDVFKRSSREESIVGRISDWLRVTGVGKALVLKPLTDRHFEICIQDLDGRVHNICDVGFGCSQVLPVLMDPLI